MVIRRPQSIERSVDVLRIKLNDAVHVVGVASISMGVDRQASDQKIAHSRTIKSPHNCFKTGKLHSLISFEGGWTAINFLAFAQDRDIRQRAQRVDPILRRPVLADIRAGWPCSASTRRANFGAISITASSRQNGKRSAEIARASNRLQPRLDEQARGGIGRDSWVDFCGSQELADTYNARAIVKLTWPLSLVMRVLRKTPLTPMRSSFR